MVLSKKKVWILYSTMMHHMMWCIACAVHRMMGGCMWSRMHIHAITRIIYHVMDRHVQCTTPYGTLQNICMEKKKHIVKGHENKAIVLAKQNFQSVT